MNKYLALIILTLFFGQNLSQELTQLEHKNSDLSLVNLCVKKIANSTNLVKKALVTIPDELFDKVLHELQEKENLFKKIHNKYKIPVNENLIIVNEAEKGFDIYDKYNNFINHSDTIVKLIRISKDGSIFATSDYEGIITIFDSMGKILGQVFGKCDFFRITPNNLILNFEYQRSQPQKNKTVLSAFNESGTLVNKTVFEKKIRLIKISESSIILASGNSIFFFNKEGKLFRTIEHCLDKGGSYPFKQYIVAIDKNNNKIAYLQDKLLVLLDKTGQIIKKTNVNALYNKLYINKNGTIILAVERKPFGSELCRISKRAEHFLSFYNHSYSDDIGFHFDLFNNIGTKLDIGYKDCKLIAISNSRIAIIREIHYYPHLRILDSAGKTIKLIKLSKLPNELYSRDDDSFIIITRAKEILTFSIFNKDGTLIKTCSGRWDRLEIKKNTLIAFDADDVCYGYTIFNKDGEPIHKGLQLSGSFEGYGDHNPKKYRYGFHIYHHEYGKDEVLLLPKPSYINNFNLYSMGERENILKPVKPSYFLYRLTMHAALEKILKNGNKTDKLEVAHKLSNLSSFRYFFQDFYGNDDDRSILKQYLTRLTE